MGCSGMLLPTSQSKEEPDSLLWCPQLLPPQALEPCRGQWGSPRWQQGREDRIWAGGCSLLLPTLMMLLPAREGTLCMARGGCTHQPNSPNSPSGCRTQPVQLPCMYSYLHMYTYVLRTGSCPALRTHHDAQGWGQGAITLCQPLTNTHTWHEIHTPPTALSLCHSVRFGAGWGSGGSGMGHWGSSISDRLGKGRLLPSPRLGSSPSLQPPQPQHLPAGYDGGLCWAPLSPRQRGQGGRGGSVTAATAPPPQGRGSDSSVATPMAYTRLEDSVRGPGAGGEGWGTKGL